MLMKKSWVDMVILNLDHRCAGPSALEQSPPLDNIGGPRIS